MLAEAELLILRNLASAFILPAFIIMIFSSLR